MAKDQYMKMTAVIDTALKGGKFRATLENGQKVEAFLSGNIRRHYIKILPGDKVDVEVSYYDVSKARITFRHRK